MKQKRKIIEIDEELCNGCGKCAQGCHEGALQIIDGKAKLVSELYCDGLGACIGDCPNNAITVEEKEVEAYDENAVMERLVPQGKEVIIAHLRHLKAHGEQKLLQQGLQYLQAHEIAVNPMEIFGGGCPGSAQQEFNTQNQPTEATGNLHSALTHWPIQLHLLNPQASFFERADVLLAADCTAFSFAAFNPNLLVNHKLAIACPKLDTNKESYIDKISQWIDIAKINTLTVVMMEVPCCGGLLKLAETALAASSRKIPIKKIIISLKGEILADEWI